LTLATIDIGTNTTLLLVARRSGPGSAAIQVVAERAEITRLGRGIGSSGSAGQLGEAGIRATLDVLREYAAIAGAHGARIVAIGTEALRRAPNARAFLDPAGAILGVPVQVIDGEREAALTFRAAVDSFPDVAGSGTVVVVDIGGGSTEIIVADRGEVRFRVSLPLGSVRLTERHVKSDPPLDAELEAVGAEIAAALSSAPLPPPRGRGDVTLIGVAGTVTSLAAMAQELASYDPARVHGYRLGGAALDAQIAHLTRSTQREREAMVGLDPRRADVILAGALILREIARKAEVPSVLVSDRGIRWGLLYEELARSETEPSA
jgi:exopolyphosphatase/guanosine-5'-triphosphate,3'-diphosphate pyrophosphatase